MSWTALDWASKQKVGSSTEKLVLICLANFANEKNECYPSHKKICEFVEIAPQTVIRALHSLRVKDFINVQARFQMTDGGKNRQTSNLYILNIPPSQNDIGGDTIKTPLPPSQNERQTYNKEPIYSEKFEEFWKKYPRKDGSKKKAKESFIKIVKKVDIEILLKSVEIFAKSSSGNNIKYIPHCTTWLNQARWETVEKEKINDSKNQLVG